jgi:phenylalanyl-tRNA synthetase alpha chain
MRVLQGADEDEKVLGVLAREGPRTAAQLEAEGIDLKRADALLRGRKGLVKEKKRVDRFLTLTEEGRSLDLEEVRVVREASQLTHEMLVSGEWKDVTLKKYDVTLESAHVHPGKTHPLRRIVDEVRRVFLEMGFTEIESPIVETSFWVFDALFQPQDHPAREMQDTFFTRSPDRGSLPENDLVRRIKEVHENGGDTGSLGWRYEWSEDVARKVLLRTHTTATTIRYLAGHPDPPSKVFSVDRVFRREKVTFKHLPEFFQVDGIIVDENASLSTLLGTLSEFYRKMGLTELKFRPSFFPYTEPSAEPYAMFRGEWMELGGSGIFRPEVTRPLGCKVPVLAWGLGLERLAMVRFGVNDIRELYFTDLDWVRGISLCR